MLELGEIFELDQLLWNSIGVFRNSSRGWFTFGHASLFRDVFACIDPIVSFIMYTLASLDFSCWIILNLLLYCIIVESLDNDVFDYYIEMLL